MSAASEEVIRTAEGVRRLSQNEAEKSIPVVLEGVLIDCDLKSHVSFVHDETGAVFVQPEVSLTSGIKRGDHVRVTGHTGSGLFAPIVEAQKFEVLGAGEIPTARPARFAELMDWRLDAQWVEVSGVVRSAAPRPGWPESSVIEVVSDELRIQTVLDNVNVDVSRKWIDSHVTFRAICLHLYNDKRQGFGARLAVPEGEPVRIIEKPTADPFALPVRAPGELLKYNRTWPDAHRVHVRGVVTLSIPNERLYLQNGDDGIEVQVHGAETYPVGEVVDAVGFVARGAFGPRLEDAEIRRSTERATLKPRVIAPRATSDADYTLVQVEGKLIGVFREPERTTLVMEAENEVFSGQLQLSHDAALSPDWQPGSILRLTGVCRVTMEPFWGIDFLQMPRSLQVMLRLPEDVVVIHPAPWWTRSRVLWVAIGALAFASGALIVTYLRFRGRLAQQQRSREAAEREFAAVLRERNRVAREIHDTLAQGLTSISAQIEVAKERLKTGSPQVANTLEVAGQLVRSSLAEARRSIWALRPQILETQDLRSALQQIGEQLTAGSSTEVQIVQTGTAKVISPEIELELLRIGQEAMTNAVRHGKPRLVQVHLRFAEGSARLEVSDDGCGIDLNAAEAQPGSRMGFGLKGLQERTKHLNGSLQIRPRQNGGTELILEIPLTA